MSDITTTWSLDSRQFTSGANRIKGETSQLSSQLSRLGGSATQLIGSLGGTATALGLVALGAKYTKDAVRDYENAIGDYYGSFRRTTAAATELRQEWGSGWSETFATVDGYLSAFVDKLEQTIEATKALGPSFVTGQSLDTAFRASRDERERAKQQARDQRNADITDGTAAARIAEERAGFGLGFTSTERMRELVEQQNRIETEAAKRAVITDRKASEAERNARIAAIEQQGQARLAAELRQFDVGQILASRSSSDSVRSTEEQSRVQSLRLRNLKGEAELLGISLQYRRQMLDVERNPALTGAERAEQLRRLAAARDQLTEASAKELVRSSRFDLARTQASLPSITLDGISALPGLSAAVFGRNTNQNAPDSELVRSMEGLRNDIRAGTEALQKLNSGGGGPTYAP